MTDQAQAIATPTNATASTTPGTPAGQYMILAAVIAGWAFALVMYFALKVQLAEPIADGGWAALLVAFRADFGQGASASTTQPPAS